MLRELRKEERDEALIHEYIKLRNLYGKAVKELEMNKENVRAFRLQRAAFSLCAVLALFLALSGIAQASGVRIWSAVLEGDIRYLDPSFGGGTDDIHMDVHEDELTKQLKQAKKDGLYFPRCFWTREGLSLVSVEYKKEKGITTYTGFYEGEYGICEIKVAIGGTLPDLPDDMNKIDYDGETGYWQINGDLVVLYHERDGILYEITFSNAIMDMSALPLQTFMSLDITGEKVVYGD